MLTLRNTPNLAGIAISGDTHDLEFLYQGLHQVVGDEEEFLPYDSVRLRVLGVCYDIRHAFQGDRELEYVKTGMSRDRMRWLGRIAPEQNLYYQVPVLYPELLFVTMALNDFVRLYSQKLARSQPFPLLDKRVLWDPAVAAVRLLQSQVAGCLRDAVSPASYGRIMNLMHHHSPWMAHYCHQYLDIVNLRYLDLADGQQRKKALLTTVKRLVEKGPEYQGLVASIHDFARVNGCLVDDVRVSPGYPETIDW